MKNKKELYLKRGYALVHSPSPIKKPTEQTKQRHKEKKPSHSRSQTLFYFCLSKEFLRTTQTVAFQWSQSQAGPRSGNPHPRMGSLASRLQGWQFPLSLLGGLLESQISWYHWQPAYHPVLQLSRFLWCFLTCWVSEVVGGEKIYSTFTSLSSMSFPFQNSLKREARYRHDHLLREE